MLRDFTIGQNDTAAPVETVLLDDRGDPVNLEGASVKLELAPPAGGALAVNGEAEIVPPPTEGRVRYPAGENAWPPAVISTPQTLIGRFRVTWGDGRQQSFPNDGYLVVTVTPAVGTPPGPTGGLCTNEEVIAMLKLTDKRAEPDEVSRAVLAATQAIETFAKRQFRAGPPDEERWYYGYRQENTAHGCAYVIPIDDAIAVTAVDDYGEDPAVPYPLIDVAPLPANRHPWEPITELLVLTAPVGRVRVVGQFGWPEVPADVKQAAIEQATAWYTLDSARQSQAFADELRVDGPVVARGLLYGVEAKLRQYRVPTLA